MSRILIPLIKAIKNNKWVRTAQLALTPFTEKPLNHLTSSTNWMYVVTIIACRIALCLRLKGPF